MSAKGTHLYLQVEEALEAFKSGVGILRDQQTQTDTLLSRGNEALDNLVQQVARIDKMQEEVEMDLRLMERFREKADQEFTLLHQKVLTDVNEHNEQTKNALDNLKADLSIRRQELLGLIQDLGAKFRQLQENSRNSEKKLTDFIKVHQDDMRSAIAEMDTKVCTFAGYCEELAARVHSVEKKNRFLLWCLIGVAVITLACILW